MSGLGERQANVTQDQWFIEQEADRRRDLELSGLGHDLQGIGVGQAFVAAVEHGDVDADVDSDVDADGALLVQTRSGEVRRVLAGDVTLRKDAP